MTDHSIVLSWPDALHSLDARAALKRLGPGDSFQASTLELDTRALAEQTSILQSIRSTLTGLMNNGSGLFGRQQLKIAGAE